MTPYLPRRIAKQLMPIVEIAKGDNEESACYGYSCFLDENIINGSEAKAVMLQTAPLGPYDDLFAQALFAKGNIDKIRQIAQYIEQQTR